MTEKITPIEEKIIEYLSLHPRRNAQQIQRAIGKPDDNYPTVVKALTRLTKEKGWVTYTEGLSEKKVTIKFYKLTSCGLGVALLKNPEALLMKTLECYEGENTELQTLFQFVRALKPSTATKLLRLTGRNIFHNGAQAWQPDTMALSAISGLGDFSKSELRALAKVARSIKPISTAVAERIKYVYDDWREGGE